MVDVGMKIKNIIITSVKSKRVIYLARKGLEWLDLIKDFMSSIVSSIANRVEDMINESEYAIKLRKRIKQYLMFAIFLVIGAIMLLNGLAWWLNSLFETWPPGIFHMIMGAIMVLVAVIYKGYKN